jgi:hypothetical protein
MPGSSTVGKCPDGVELPEPPVEDVDGCFDPLEPELAQAVPTTASSTTSAILRARIESPHCRGLARRGGAKLTSRGRLNKDGICRRLKPGASFTMAA